MSRCDTAVKRAEWKELPTEGELHAYFNCARIKDSVHAYKVHGWCPKCRGPIDNDIGPRLEDFKRTGLLLRRQLKDGLVRQLEFICGCGYPHPYPDSEQVAAKPGCANGFVEQVHFPPCDGDGGPLKVVLTP